LEIPLLDGKTYLLVDQFGGFQTVADAVNTAAGGETILIAAPISTRGTATALVDTSTTKSDAARR
jgi:hypothetical protein